MAAAIQYPLPTSPVISQPMVQVDGSGNPVGRGATPMPAIQYPLPTSPVQATPVIQVDGSGNPVGSPNQYVFNPADYGYVDPTGVNDSTQAITTANNLANAAGGGKIQFGPGTFITTKQLIHSKVHWEGAGIEATILLLKAGTNDHLLQGDVIGYSGSGKICDVTSANGSGAMAGTFNWSIQNMTLDGNKTNQSSGTSYPLIVYGYGYILHNVRIRNGYTGGFLSDWNGGGAVTGANAADQMEAHVTNLKVHDNNGHGIQLGGPHDSMWANVLSFNNQYHAFHITPNMTGFMLANGHGWNSSHGVQACSFLIESVSGYYLNCAAEGSDFVQCAILGSWNEWHGGQIFGSPTGLTTIGLQIGCQAGQTPFAGMVYQSAGVTLLEAPAGIRVNTNLLRCESTTGAIYPAADGGDCDIQATVFTSTGNGLAINASTASNSSYRINAHGFTADGTKGKGGFTQISNKSNNGFTITDRTNDKFNVNTNGSKVELPNGSSLVIYSDSYTTKTTQLVNGTICLGQTTSAQVIASNAAITGVNTNGIVYVAPTGNVTGITLPVAAQASQTLRVVNESAFTVTFDVQATSKVADGASAVIAANRYMDFVWDSRLSLWYHS